MSAQKTYTPVMLYLETYMCISMHISVCKTNNSKREQEGYIGESGGREEEGKMV